jgi:hypothetical protein
MKLPWLITLLPLALLSSLSVFATQTTSVDYGTIGVQNNELYVKNNTWGKGTITGYTANVWATDADSKNKYNWDTGANWIWPAGGGVKSYQEMVYGYVGSGVYTIGTKLPTYLGANKSMKVSWSYSLTTDTSSAYATPQCNASLDVFLRKDNSGPSSTIEGELMIWLSSKNWTPNSSYYQGVVSIAGVNYKLYYNPTATNGTTTWKYVAFIRSTETTSVTDLDLKPFTDYMQTKGWARSGQNIYSIESGFEAIQGKGSGTTYWYSVSVL